MDPYDIEQAFAAIEEELIASMIRNMQRHRVEEKAEGMNWSMWQAEQLKSMEQYKNTNKKQFKKQFSHINLSIENMIIKAQKQGGMDQEREILKAIQNGFTGYRKSSDTMQAAFFRLNERKLNALIEATTHDMEKAETAVLRMANDQYRKAIFNAQVYANTGAGTYEKAVDMATKDMLSSGLNCVEYKNGARHTLADYADMAIRTAAKRAYLQGEGEKRQEWGISTVIMNKRGNPCPKCLPFVGKILIDDVWSGGKISDGSYPLMSTAIAAGLYHPRCKDSHTTYFEGVSEKPNDTFTKKELAAIEKGIKKEVRLQYAKRQLNKYERLEQYSLDAENREKYKMKAFEWKNIAEDDILKEKYPMQDIITDLPAIDKVVNNSDRKNFAQKLIRKLGINQDELNINIKPTGLHGYCAIHEDSLLNCKYSEYVLKGDDRRPLRYQIKTAFHEAYHLKLNGREWDAIMIGGSINEKWAMIEETFAESSAHYAAKLYGIKDAISPSYSNYLMETLPRMKRLPKFESCSTMEDFGKIAWEERLEGKGGTWSKLYDDVFGVELPEDYYTQYFEYIRSHEDKLLDMMLENMPGYEDYREEMKVDLFQAMSKVEKGTALESDENTVFSGVLLNAMKEVGIK